MSHRKRRKFTAEFKFETVLEALRGEKSAAQICREREISETLLTRWKQDFLSKGPDLFESQTKGKDSQLEVRIVELERLMGRQALEIEILKKAGALLGSSVPVSWRWPPT
jgi:transposase-like protein